MVNVSVPFVLAAALLLGVIAGAITFAVTNNQTHAWRAFFGGVALVPASLAVFVLVVSFSPMR
jgi:hypothetical protein